MEENPTPLLARTVARRGKGTRLIIRAGYKNLAEGPIPCLSGDTVLYRAFPYVSV